MFQPDEEMDNGETHIVFLCDTSGSMSGERISNLNNAISSALSTVVATFDHSIFDAIDVSAIRFSDAADWHLVPSKLHDQFIWDDIQQPNGITNLGQAYTLLDNWLTSGAVNGAIQTLILVLITDGMPTDEPKLPEQWLATNKLSAKFERIAFALGSDAESSYLDDFVSNEDNLYVLRNESMLKEFLSRALTNTIKKMPHGKQRHH